MDQANRRLLGTILALSGLACLSLALLLLYGIFASTAMAVKFEEGSLPPNSEGVAHSAQLDVLAVTALVAGSTALAIGTQWSRPHILLQLIAALLLLSLLGVVPLLWIAYQLAY